MSANIRTWKSNVAAVFWLDFRSMHKVPLIREFAKRVRGEVLVVTETEVPNTRTTQGWTDPTLGPATEFVAPDQATRRFIEEIAASRDVVNFFYGFYAYRNNYTSLLNVRKSDSFVVVFAEGGAIHDGMRVWLRRFRHALSVFRWVGGIDVFLAAGDNGIRWYRGCGVPGNKLVSFGYFVESDTEEQNPGPTLSNSVFKPQPYRGPLEFLFVGAVEKHKGLNEVIVALSELCESSWALTVVGTGSQLESCVQLAEEGGIGDRIRWLGNRDNREVRKLYEKADSLLLFGRYDGWGAVVNEALLGGCPAVVSDAVGAHDLVSSLGAGVVVQAGDLTHLRQALARVVASGKPSAKRRANIRAGARSACTAEAGAEYLDQIVHSVRHGRTIPHPPWKGGGLADRSQGEIYRSK